MKKEATPGTKRTCLRCEHEWFQVRPGTPVKCPKCGSPYWDKPRKT